MTTDEIETNHPSGIEIPGVVIVNPLPWSRTISGRLTCDVLDPRGWYDDPTSTRHHQDRDMDRPLTSAVYHIGEFFGFYNAFDADENFLLPPTEIPGFGYAVVPRTELVREREWSYDERATVRTDRYEVTFDRDRGGIASWYDRELDCEWVDRNAAYSLGGFVYERIADSDEKRPRQLFYRTPSGDDVEDPLHPPTGWQFDPRLTRNGDTTVERHRVLETPAGTQVEQRLDVPGVEGLAELRFLLPNGDDSIVIEAEWTMGLANHPEATYLAFPFDLPGPEAHLDVGGQAIQPGPDQLPETCFDYYSVQRWVDLSNDERGMTVGCPLNPLVQLGDFDFGKKQSEFELDRALLLGWVTNNYWDTNFRAHQPGTVRARYHLSPHQGEFDEATAHRIGFEAEYWEPLANSLGEEPDDGASLPSSGSWLDLPDPPVLSLQVRPDSQADEPFYPVEGGGTAATTANSSSGKDTADTDTTMSILLRNASDESQTAAIRSDVLRITAAADVGLLGRSEDSISVDEGTIEVDLAPRENKRISLDCEN